MGGSIRKHRHNQEPKDSQRVKPPVVRSEVVPLFILGAFGVGKTQFVQTWSSWHTTEGEVNLPEDSMYLGPSVTLPDASLQPVGIYDTNGEERFVSGRHEDLFDLVRNSRGLIFAFDLTRPETFECVKDCYSDYVTGKFPYQSLQCALIGTKADLVPSLLSFGEDPWTRERDVVCTAFYARAMAGRSRKRKDCGVWASLPFEILVQIIQTHRSLNQVPDWLFEYQDWAEEKWMPFFVASSVAGLNLVQPVEALVHKVFEAGQKYW